MKRGSRNLTSTSPDSPQTFVSSNPPFDTSSESPDTWNSSSQSTPAATSRQASSPGDEEAEYTAVGAAIQVQEIETNLQDGNDHMSSIGPTSSERHMYVQLSALRVSLRLAEASLLDKVPILYDTRTCLSLWKQVQSALFVYWSQENCRLLNRGGQFTSKYWTSIHSIYKLTPTFTCKDSTTSSHYRSLSWDQAMHAAITIDR